MSTDASVDTEMHMETPRKVVHSKCFYMCTNAYRYIVFAQKNLNTLGSVKWIEIPCGHMHCYTNFTNILSVVRHILSIVWASKADGNVVYNTSVQRISPDWICHPKKRRWCKFYITRRREMREEVCVRVVWGRLGFVWWERGCFDALSQPLLSLIPCVWMNKDEHCRHCQLPMSI